MEITVALGEEDTATGHFTRLGSAGHTRGTGQDSDLPNPVKVKATLTVPCTISTGGPHIVYAEGDTVPIVDPDMSLEKFARRNAGSYLVVTLQLD